MATFATTPGSAIDGVIDYATTEGRKYYERATASLFPEADRFDCEPEQLQHFLNKLAHRGKQFEWNVNVPGQPYDDQGVLIVSEDPTDPASKRYDLTKDYQHRAKGRWDNSFNAASPD